MPYGAYVHHGVRGVAKAELPIQAQHHDAAPDLNREVLRAEGLEGGLSRRIRCVAGKEVKHSTTNIGNGKR
jgi:hypothetical protein